MAKELNSEFDIQARVQKSFAEATQKKIESHQALNDKEIEHLNLKPENILYDFNN